MALLRYGTLYRMTVENLPVWLRSSTCSGGQCVWITEDADKDAILVRDNMATQQLTFTRYAWSDFLNGLDADDFHF